MAKSKKSKGKKINLTGVTVGGTLNEGTYAVKVKEAEIKASKSSGEDVLEVQFEVTSKKGKGHILYHVCSLQPQALFKLKQLFIGIGFKFPENKAFELEADDLVGLESTVEVINKEHEGKEYSNIAKFISESEEDDDDDEDDEEDDEEDEEDEEEEDDAVDYSELSLKELKALCKEEGLKVEKGASKEDLIELLSDEEKDEDEEEEDEDEDEDEVDYDELSLKELKAECKTRGLKVPKRSDKDDLVELLETDDEE